MFTIKNIALCKKVLISFLYGLFVLLFGYPIVFAADSTIPASGITSTFSISAVSGVYPASSVTSVP
jgi:hypothetical protein